MSDVVVSEDKFGFATYVHIISDITLQPKVFFQNKLLFKSWKTPLSVLMISGLIFSISSVVASMSKTPLMMGLVYFTNAVGMVFITSGMGYVLLRLFMKTKVSYQRVFAIYAYASSAVLILSWLPYMIWVTEPWRWWMIGCGLVKNFGFTIKGALAIVLLSILMILATVNCILLVT